MRFPFVLLLFWFLLAAVACESDHISFADPQPAGVESDASLRSDFQGTYLNETDSLYLEISENKVIAHLPEINLDVDSAHLSVEGNPNSEARITLGKDTAAAVKMKVKINNEKDAVHIESRFEETILNLDKGDVARYRKGYYFLNQKMETGEGYTVRILRKTHDGLMLCRIQSDSVLQLLRHEDFISQVGDGENWVLRPSRKELKRLIHMGLFSNVLYYRKVEN